MSFQLLPLFAVELLGFFFAQFEHLSQTSHLVLKEADLVMKVGGSLPILDNEVVSSLDELDLKVG